jgi:hypothetical protein
LYINNLVNDLKIGHTHPLIVGDVTVTSLLYADDIILVSESKEGLQNGLNMLRKFTSAYNRDVTVTSPTISGWVCPILRSFTRLLIYKMKLNKVGLRTSFCFTPQVDVKS